MNATAAFSYSPPSLVAESFTMTREQNTKTYQLPAPLEQRTYLCGGNIVTWDGAAADVTTPFPLDGISAKIGSYPLLNSTQALQAIHAAQIAFNHGLGTWPAKSAEERIDAMVNFCARLLPQREKISQLIMLETAKPLEMCFKEFDRTVEYIERTVAAYRALIHADSQTHEFGAKLATHIERTPLGTVLCLGPFNYPLNETFTSLIPALLMGNTVVMKPARFGVLLFEPLLEAFRDSFPPGAVNIIYGEGAQVITPIMESGKVDVLAFIGSTKVADIISRAHPEPHRLTKVLGLAAHNPSITLPETDLDRIMPELLAGSLTFNGQRCTTLALHFVHRSQGAEYAEKLGAHVRRMKHGLPWEGGVEVTALAEGEAKWAYLKELIEDAVAKGARIVNAGGGTVQNGIMTPAVLYPIDKSMRIFHEEQFGPIVPIAPYDELAQVISAISESRYGQQLSIFGNDIAAARTLAKTTRNLVSRVNINGQCQRGPDELPFSGKKDSGLGTLSITDALIVFSSPTVMAETLNRDR